MGYRHKIGVLKKEKHNEFKDLNLDELKKWFHKREVSNDDYIPIYEITNEIFELGKYVDDSYLEPFRTSISNVYQVDEYFNEEQDF